MGSSSTTLAERLVRLLPRLRSRLAKRTPDADDATQDVMVRALRYSEGFDESRPLWPWVRRIADRVVVDRSLRAAKEPLAGEFDDPVDESSTGERESEEVVERLLAGLRTIERDVLVAFHVQEHSVGEIARSMGLPEGTVRSHLSRARKKLAGLGREGRTKNER